MKQLNLKMLFISVVVIVLVLTVCVCIVKPNIHKPFQINIIEYLMKINSDGSISTQKSITTTVIKEK